MRHALFLSALLANVVAAQDWRPAYPVTEPGPKFATNMAFAAARGEIVLFGGQISPPASNETWTLNGTNWTLRAPAASPIGRVYPSMCYDSTRQRVVIYGGQSGTT